MPFIPKSAQQQSKTKTKQGSPIPAPPPMESTRHQTERSLEDLFERLHALRSYLASTETPLMSPDDTEQYRPTEPEYYGSDGVQNSAREVYGGGGRKEDQGTPGSLSTAIFG